MIKRAHRMKKMSRIKPGEEGIPSRKANMSKTLHPEEN
jgi:hypothetical protein